MQPATTIQNVPFEHERRFYPKQDLSDLPFDYRLYKKSEILQGYIPEVKNVRIRQEYKDGKFKFTRTIKEGSGVSRPEDEIQISDEKFHRAWKQVNCFLIKTRYFIPWEGAVIELNFFHGFLEGYIQIEIEFKSAIAAASFRPYDWLGVEVTEVFEHGSYSLAKFGIPDEDE